MHRVRGHSGGLAEIVGTLMLVVIVVAAATAFSFFVASYQKQLQNEETLNHDRTLEDVKAISVSEITCGEWPLGCNSSSKWTSSSIASLSIEIASLDVNPIEVIGLFIDGHEVVNYTAQYPGEGSSGPCYNDSLHKEEAAQKPYAGVVACSPFTLRPYGASVFNLDLDAIPSNALATPILALGIGDGGILTSQVLSFQLLTERANLFTETFTPPVPIISVYYVSNGTSSIPVFDGLSSFQSAGPTNTTIVGYNWTTEPVKTTTPLACPTATGPEFECGSFASKDAYAVTLTVTNSDGLSNSNTIQYTQPT